MYKKINTINYRCLKYLRGTQWIIWSTTWERRTKNPAKFICTSSRIPSTMIQGGSFSKKMFQMWIFTHFLSAQIRTALRHLWPGRRALGQPLLLHQLFPLWCVRQSIVFHSHLRTRHRLLHFGVSRTRPAIVWRSQCPNASARSHSVRHAHLSHGTAAKVGVAHTAIVWDSAAARYTGPGAIVVAAQLAWRAARCRLSGAGRSVSFLFKNNFLNQLLTWWAINKTLQKRKTRFVVGIGKVSNRLGHVHVQSKRCHLYSARCARCKGTK